MQIHLHRTDFTAESTVGELCFGKFRCFTLEDRDRNLEDKPDAKIYGRTAIPRGTYKVLITYSNRFRRELPLLLDVPGFEGVRIHPGNSAKDTEGCILVGSTRQKDFVGNSRATFVTLFNLIEDALDCGNEIELAIT